MTEPLRLFLPFDSTAAALGADDVAEALVETAKKRGQLISLVRTGSRGMHWLEPLLEVERDGVRVGYGPLEPDDAGGVLDALISDLPCEKKLGPVEAIPFFAQQSRLIFARCGKTNPVSLDDYKANGGYAALPKAGAMEGALICDQIMESGLRGRGGAGFPAGIKWKTVAETKATQKYIVVNADEGDSGTFADRMIMEGDPFLLIEGMIIAGNGCRRYKGFYLLTFGVPDHCRNFKESTRYCL